MSIFTPRVAFKPFEYPNVTEYKKAINNSYWLVTEWNFVADAQQFYVHLSDTEREIVKKALLAISQIEIAVKRFWSQVGTHLPKPEIEQVGVTFAECEVRHADAYSHLLQVLGLNEDFEEVLQEPLISRRMNYLTKYLNKAVDDRQDYAFVMALFSIFIENVSLFSQFLVVKSFSTFKNSLKDIDNVIQATQKEEMIHALFGIELINYIKSEFPQWFNEDFYKKLRAVSLKAFKAESNIIDWIFTDGTLPFLHVDAIKEFVKQRINESVEAIGGAPVFELNHDLLREVSWFTDELYAEVNTDFFYKKPVTYSKRSQSVTATDLF